MRKTTSKNSIIYQDFFLLSPLIVTIFIGLVLTILVYTIIEESHIMDRYGKLIWYQPFLLILGLMIPLYRSILFLKKIRFKAGIKDPFLLRLITKNSLDKICLEINKRLGSAELTSADILTEMLESKINTIYNKDCLRFPKICKELDQYGLIEENKTLFNEFFTSSEIYKTKPFPVEIRLLSDIVKRKRKDLKKELKNLISRYYDLITFFGNYLSLWPINEKKIEAIAKKYKYRPPSKDQALRIVFALQISSHISKFKTGNLSSNDLNSYEVMAEELISNFSVLVENYTTAWEDIVIKYESIS